jgi:uncharacterized protein (DUF58 family)
LKITLAGILYILVLLLLGFGAVNTGNNLLYLMVSALLGLMTVSGFLGRVNLRSLEVDLDLPEEIYDGIETLVNVRIKNRKRRLPAFLLRVELQGNGVVLRTVGARGEASVSMAAVFHGRGVQRLSGIRIASIFPINFFVRSFAFPLQREFLVFATPHPCRPEEAKGAVRSAGGALQKGRGDEGDIDRIDDYTGGEPLKSIHWKLSARQGDLKVKQTGSTAREPVLLELVHLPGNDLEEKLRSATYLVNRLIREERPVGLKLANRIIAPAITRGHRMHLLRELALYGQA